MRAYGGRVGHFPRPRFVAIGSAGERADGTDINAHAAFFAFEMVFAIWNDDGIYAALADAERFHAHAFIANTDAAEAQNAARRVVINRLGPFFFRSVIFFFDEAALVRAVTENHVLQFAL